MLNEKNDSADQHPKNHRLNKVPFYQRPLSQIEETELFEIEKLEEGWFVEFKRELPESSKVARSISSFANSHGGLVVIGAVENQKNRNFDSWKLMTKHQANDSIERIRNASIAHLTPSPFYEIEAFKHPGDGNDEEKCWLVLLRIPKGTNGPYLHSNGCVYVRVGDSAAPMPLNDLGQMERIWSETAKRKNDLKERIEFLSDQYLNGLPSFQFVIAADEKLFDENSKEAFSLFKKHALSQHANSTKPLFNRIQTLDNSYVARLINQLGGPASIVWDFDRSRRLHIIHLPIATHLWERSNYQESIGDKFASAGLEKLRPFLLNQTNDRCIICNLLPSLYFLSIVLYKIKAFHKELGDHALLRLNARAVDVKNTIPYLDTKRYFSEAESLGVPQIFRDLDFISPLNQLSSWIELSELDESQAGLNGIDLSNTFTVFILAGISLGVSAYISAGVSETSREEIEIGELVRNFSIMASTAFSWTNRSNPDAKKVRF